INACTAGFSAGDASFARALAIDPGYAEALSVRAHSLAYLGRFAEAHAAFEACFAASPASYLCSHHLMQLLESEGACEKVESIARQRMAAGAGASMSMALAEALASEGRPPATVREALRHTWSGIPAAAIAEDELRQTIDADLLAGDFDAGERHARELAQT